MVGLDHKVQLPGAEKQCIVPKDEGDSTCRSQQQVKLLKYTNSSLEAVCIVQGYVTTILSVYQYQMSIHINHNQ